MTPDTLARLRRTDTAPLEARLRATGITAAIVRRGATSISTADGWTYYVEHGHVRAVRPRGDGSRERRTLTEA
jgi:hypothetical protein